MNALAAARAAVRRGLPRVTSELDALGLHLPDVGGQAIRPLVAYAVARALGHPCDEQFWRAALSVQLAHEASLVHDDVIDGADERRGAESVHAARGVAAAIVMGDHMLTAGYRLAAGTASITWMRMYAEALERTVAGELLQARVRGRPLTTAEYRSVVTGKSGELLGLAAAAAPALGEDARANDYRELGRALGVLYQMLDDLLDYCPGTTAGKPALRDHAQRHWTWVLSELGGDALEAPDAAVLERLHARDPSGGSALRRALDTYAAEIATFLHQHRALIPDDAVLPAMLEDWLERARGAVAAEEVLRAARAVAGDAAVLARHGRSFRFAARLFGPAARRGVAAVYAFCRFTDDLVDEDDAPMEERRQRLDAWCALARRVYHGERTGIGFLDRSVGVMQQQNIPFTYVAELIAGVRMDLEVDRYASLAELRGYTYRVAAVVGLWLTRLFGVHDDATLQRAAALGHAMQMTNILRDVGEDLRRGRLYVPLATLAEFGLDERDLETMLRTGDAGERWTRLVEYLIAVAERDYAQALVALGRLPLAVRAPVAVAAYVYAGIHDAIRANAYDTFTRRAATDRSAKMRLGAAALAAVVGRSGYARPRRATTAAALAAVLAVGPAAAQRPVRTAAADRPAIEVTARLAAVEARLARSPDDECLQLDRLRVLYFQAVSDARAVAAGLEQIATLRQTDLAAVTLLEAYRGAFETLRAKHAPWPATKLRALRSGMRTLDAAVAAAPDHAEVRYLRLMSGYHLPGFLGRRAEVAADLEHLVALLQDDDPRISPDVRRAAARFVLEHAALAPATRATITASVSPDGT